MKYSPIVLRPHRWEPGILILFYCCWCRHSLVYYPASALVSRCSAKARVGWGLFVSLWCSSAAIVSDTNTQVHLVLSAYLGTLPPVYGVLGNPSHCVVGMWLVSHPVCTVKWLPQRWSGKVLAPGTQDQFTQGHTCFPCEICSGALSCCKAGPLLLFCFSTQAHLFCYHEFLTRSWADTSTMLFLSFRVMSQTLHKSRTLS